MDVAGVILAGGLSRRMGQDKALLPLAGRPLLAHVIDRARPQVLSLVLNANGDASRFAAFGLAVVADSIDNHVGPLAGILAGLDWVARERPETGFVASFACDTPFFPRDLVARLVAVAGKSGERLVCAASGGRVHPVFALWPVALREELRRAIVADGVRKVDIFTARHDAVIVEFAAAPFDPFFNINNPDDMARAEGLLAMAVAARDNGGAGPGD